MNDLKHLNQLIANHMHRLQKLKEQQALYGIDTPPHISIEIDEIEKKIRELQRQSNRLKIDTYEIQSVENSDPLTFPVPTLATKGTIRNKEMKGLVSNIAICKNEPNVIYGSFDDTLHVSLDGARTWKDISINPRKIAVNPITPQKVYGLFENRILASVDFGNTWEPLSFFETHHPLLNSSFECINDDVLVFSNYEGIFISQNSGIFWNEHFSDTPLYGDTLWFFATDNQQEGTIVSVGYNREFYKTTDYGSTWTMLQQPTKIKHLSPGLIRPLLLSPNSSNIWYSNLGEINSHTDGLFFSSNEGKTWILKSKSIIDDIRYIDYMEFVESYGKIILYVVSRQKAYYSSDYGESWSPLRISWKGIPKEVENDILFNLNVIDAQTKNGLVYLKTSKGLLKSIDNGQTWYY